MLSMNFLNHVLQDYNFTMLRKIASPRKIVLLFLAGLFFIVLYLISGLQNNFFSHKVEHRELPSAPSCNHNRLVYFPHNHHSQDKGANEKSQTRQKILLFLRQGKNQLGRDIVQLLETVRFKFHAQVGEIGNLPVLIDDNKGRYGLIIFEDMSTYLSLHQWNREMIDKYCLDFHVGMLLFVRPLKQKGNHEFQQWDECLDNDWNVFELGHQTYHAVSYAVEANSPVFPDCGHTRRRAKRKTKKMRRGRGVFASIDAFSNLLNEDNSDKVEKLATVVYDTGQHDGVQRVIFGGNLKFWLHKVLFLDALSCLSHGRLSMPLERYIQIDIDDMFVGEVGHRMDSDDFMALVSFQNKLREVVPGFRFLLGFSGKFIFSGNEAESKADRLFLKLHDNFSWFPHMWSHMQAHWFNNTTKLCEYMNVNYQFAERWHLNTSSQYAVAPHHAGVFPIHEQLYECWKKVWNITTTSTEEYPHLRPDHKRRGFVHRGIKVMPRQTCGLFTHTIMLEDYPGGPDVLHALIHGGSLFQSFLTNQINIFMTHLPNYGNDRLGIYTFDRVIKFVQCWTNLNLLQVSPTEMAEKYFNLYPDEVDPVWLDPCADKRHLEIWSNEKDCSRFPDFVIVGPQKTGTTALYWFLNMHPNVESNRPSPTTFEEIQFFSGTNYHKGIDWYMNYFPFPKNDTIIFEKSATYFDQGIVAKRLHALLPRRPIVVILIDPAKRAYSWYQHMKSHDDKTALQYSFYDIIRAKRKGSSQPLISLQRRCLDPGFYADILEKWLEYLKPSNIVVVDGETLKDNPAEAMKELQIELNFKKILDYKNILRFDKKKGFFCQLLDNGKTKCLGLSKGRQYPEIDEQSREFLKKYYSEANTKLIRILKSMNKPVPAWLKESNKR